MAAGDYSKTTYVNGSAPAISASNLNNIEDKVDELDAIVGTLVGSVTMYAGSSAPTGWLLCNGQAVSRTTYSALFSSIGTTWGTGDGSTTFNVPDLRGAAPAGVGTSTGYTQNETLALGTKYNDQMQGHLHDGGDLGANSGGSGGPATKYLVIGGVGNVAATTPAVLTSFKHDKTVTDGTNGTPRTGNVTRGKRVGLNFIIKY